MSGAVTNAGRNWARDGICKEVVVTITVELIGVGAIGRCSRCVATLSIHNLVV
jgi:hypothetical protein